MFFVYIIYSSKIDRYYIGQTQNVVERIQQHNTSFFKNSYTSKASDWELKLSIECIDRKSALKLENYIKSMRNRKFIESIIKDRSKIIDITNRLNN